MMSMILNVNCIGGSSNKLNKFPVASFVIVYAISIPMQQYATFIMIFEDPSCNDFSIDKANDASGERKSSVIPKT